VIVIISVLSVLDIDLSYTHRAAPHLNGWSYNEVNTNCIYDRTKTKENPFLFVLVVICLKFLDHKSLLQLFLNYDTSVLFLTLSFSLQN